MPPRTTTGTAITGHGVWHPDNILSNDELVAAFNEFVARDNAKHADQIAAGTRKPETIEQDSRSRFTKTFDFDPVAPGSPQQASRQGAASGG